MMRISKSICIAAACLVTTIVALPDFASADDRQPVLCVFDIELKGVRLASMLTDNLTDYISTKMAEGGRFQVVPREQIKARLTKNKTESHIECYSQSCQIELGQELAADKTLAVKIMKLGASCTVSMSLYDLRRFTTDNAATASGACAETGIVASVNAAVASLLPLVVIRRNLDIVVGMG